MGLFGEDLLFEDRDACSLLLSFSGSRSSTFSNASSHRFDHIKVNFQGLFFFLTRIGLLTKSWHNWRLYATQRVVKTRLKEVARYAYFKFITKS